VLIVDDSSAIRMILRRVVSDSQLPIENISDAGDGVQALEKLQGGNFGLVLCDINMPNMDGIAFLEKMRSDQANEEVRVVMITTEGSTDKVNRALELGANGYIKKPFTTEQIHDRVSSLF
jgi:two-component system chemotaxis response regulator CheY